MLCYAASIELKQTWKEHSYSHYSEMQPEWDKMDILVAISIIPWSCCPSDIFTEVPVTLHFALQ